MFLDFPDFCKKLLQILQDAVPAISTVAVFWDPGTGAAQLEAVQSAARALELKLVVSEIRNETDVQPALQIAKDQHAAGLLILSSPYVGANTKSLATRALAAKLPAITPIF